MTGYPDLNRTAFRDAERALRDAGHEPVCPVDNGLADHDTWEAHLRADLVMLLGCDAVATLPGYRRSRGARLETSTARRLGIPVLTVDRACKP